MKPALATVAIFSFMAHWNDFLGPLIYLSSPAKRTLALGLYAFQGQYCDRLELPDGGIDGRDAAAADPVLLSARSTSSRAS